MRVSALLATHDLYEESLPWLRKVRDIFDELIIFIDEKRARPGVIERAEKVATRVLRHQANTWYDWDLGGMARQCESDWIFVIERDEELSPEWEQPSWRQILIDTPFTHFWCPRRWIVPGKQYLNCDPWWPDLQLRFFKNDGDATFPTRLHDPMSVLGPAACLRHLAIHHHVLWLCSRAMREERVRYYEQLRPGGALGHYYLYEDYSPRAAVLPEPIRLNPDNEIGSMDILTQECVEKISLELSDVPEQARVSEWFWIKALVENRTSETLSALPPYPVRLSYHWQEKETGETIVFDGNRSGLFPGMAADSSGQYSMSVLAPNQPGEYILQATLVQESVRWFEEVRPDIVCEQNVSVLQHA